MKKGIAFKKSVAISPTISPPPKQIREQKIVIPYKKRLTHEGVCGEISIFIYGIYLITSVYKYHYP